MNIALTLAPQDRRRPKPADESALGFGRIFSDHMFLMDYTEGKGWRDARVVPYGALPIDPAAMVLHYGQEIFEGLKAYRGKNGAICLFRPGMNFERMNRSAQRLCMPQVPVDDAIAAVEALLRVDRDWIPGTRGTSLYIRPTMIATEPGLGVRPASRYLYFIITGPVGNYYARGFEPVRILVEETYVRAARGGLGEAKTAANYAASLRAALAAKEKGFDQVLWLDAAGRGEIEEVGTMNIFFVIGDSIVTPPLAGSILPGVTRDSVLRLLRDWKMNVAERPIGVDEVRRAAADGSLREAFGTGTAAVISPVGQLCFRGETFSVNGSRPGEISSRLFAEITGIQYGEREDRHGWVHSVKGE